jgi:hypothetical protein
MMGRATVVQQGRSLAEKVGSERHARSTKIVIPSNARNLNRTETEHA